MKQATKLLSLLTALSLLLALTACGGSAPASSAPVESTEASAAEPAEEAGEPEAAEATDVEEAGSEEETAEAPEDSEEPEIVIEYPLFDTPQTYTIWFSNSPDLSEIINDMNEYLVFRELEKITNVKWDPTMVSFFASSEQFSLMVASQDYTDVVCRAIDSYAGSVDQAIEEEFLIDLVPYIDDNMPNLTGWFGKYPELKDALLTTEGAIGGFPKIYKEYSDVTSGGCLRLDWLEDLGIDEPKTYDDLYNLLVAFRDKKGASKPLIISSPIGVQSELMNGYNIGASYQIDGVVHFGILEPEYREYLEMMNKWWNEGLINDLFLTQQSENLMNVSDVLNGQSGVWYGTAAQTMTNILSQSTDPNMRITGITNITKDGSVAHLGETGQIYDSNMWSITTECADPEVICQYIDYIYSDEGVLLANYGVEGETFEYDENGNPRLTELVTNNPDYTYSLALNIYCCDRQTPIPFVIDETKTRDYYTEDQWNSIQVWNEATDGLYNMPRFGMSMTTEETNEYNAIYTDIDTYVDENVVKFIVGDKSFDEYDDFINTLKQMDIEKLLELSQTVYDRYLEG